MTTAVMTSSTNVPAAAKWLGYAGLLPFFALAVLVAVVGSEGAAGQGLMSYGAVILAFIGGCRWGFAAAGMGEGVAMRPLALSVVPALYAWVAMQLPFAWAAAALAFGFVCLFLSDKALTGQGGAPAWWTALRAPLTAGASLSLVAGAALA
ncbi:MAG: DUF3429 domain-containing protein [Pseudomonadota bacterium]